MSAYDKNEDFALVIQLRKLTKNIGVGISEKTKAEYETVYQRMLRKNETPDDAGSRSAYYLRRAAMIFHCSNEASEALKQKDKQPYGTPEWEVSMAKIRELVKIFERFPPDPERKHHASGSSSYAWSDVKALKISDGWKAPKNSKKHGLGGLVRREGWMDLLFDSISPDYQNALAVAMLTGARPAEIQHGVKVKVTSEGMEITIAGAKLGEHRGQPERTLLIALESKAAKHLADLAKDETISIQANAKRFCDATRLAGKRAFPSLRSSVSPYTLRHAIASTLKAAGVDPDGLAQVLGHRASRSQQSYGLACHRNKQSNSILGVRASLQVKGNGRHPTNSVCRTTGPQFG